ncbi:MAG: precorrin-3B C(17)-methyltransferase [Mogibacterium sp.]|nr:precorrin-3B C(17)-methyltransferase [Mogibacterium sp.]
MKEILIVGLGPGAESMMTGEALAALDRADVIVGYTVYLELLGDRYRDKELLSTPMKQEVERCRLCFEQASGGRTTALVCSGDAGIYGLASLMLELAQAYDPDIGITVVPGITAACSGAAVLGAPINHDFCVISLSDLLTPWEVIRKRLEAAAAGDFAIVLYNPSSKKRADHLRKACDLLLQTMKTDRPCGYVRNIGRAGTESRVCTLRELRDAQVDMFTTVFIGNSATRILNGRLVTPRGYQL